MFSVSTRETSPGFTADVRLVGDLATESATEYTVSMICESADFVYDFL